MMHVEMHQSSSGTELGLLSRGRAAFARKALKSREASAGAGTGAMNHEPADTERGLDASVLVPSIPGSQPRWISPHPASRPPKASGAEPAVPTQPQLSLLSPVPGEQCHHPRLTPHLPKGAPRRLCSPFPPTIAGCSTPPAMPPPWPGSAPHQRCPSLPKSPLPSVA